MKRRACSGARIPPAAPVGFTAFAPDVDPNAAVAVLPSCDPTDAAAESKPVALPTPPDTNEP
jgi:hypothetical protein